MKINTVLKLLFLRITNFLTILIGTKIIRQCNAYIVLYLLQYFGWNLYAGQIKIITIFYLMKVSGEAHFLQSSLPPAHTKQNRHWRILWECVTTSCDLPSPTAPEVIRSTVVLQLDKFQ